MTEMKTPTAREAAGVEGFSLGQLDPSTLNKFHLQPAVLRLLRRGDVYIVDKNLLVLARVRGVLK